MRKPILLATSLLIAAVAVFLAAHYLIQASGVGIGSWTYCLIIGLGVGIVSTVWRMTKPKTEAPTISNQDDTGQLAGPFSTSAPGALAQRVFRK